MVRACALGRVAHGGMSGALLALVAPAVYQVVLVGARPEAHRESRCVV